MKDLLKKSAIDYVLAPSSLVSNNSGEIIAMENYYPNND
jgi:hypothetical protein